MIIFIIARKPISTINTILICIDVVINNAINTIFTCSNLVFSDITFILFLSLLFELLVFLVIVV